MALPFLRRRSTYWLIAAVVTLGIAGILAAIGGQLTPNDDDATASTPAATSPATTPGATSAAPTTPTPLVVAPPDLHLNPASLQRAEVVEVIDGDTIDVRVGGSEERVRYFGIDTRERGEACYGEAKDRNAELAGDAVLLLPDARDRDRYDRLLRYVFLQDGESLDARLIAEGLALAWREDGAYRDQLIALEDQAHAAHVGCLWQ